MANTGRVIVDEIINTATGAIKPNVVGDPDYIPPYDDLIGCPIEYDYFCPVVYGTAHATGLTIEYEFGLPNSVAKNPDIDKIQVRLYGPTLLQSHDYPMPVSSNYFHSQFTGLINGPSYTIKIGYMDAAGADLAIECSDSNIYDFGP